MSVPARTIPAPTPPRTPPADRPDEIPAPGTPPAPTRAARRKHHLGFALLASFVVGTMVFGIVVVHVLLAQQSFRVEEAERRLEGLALERLELVRERATLSAPGRIAEWASRHGMRLPDDIRILRAPNGPTDPAGAGTSLTTVGTGTPAER